MMPDLLEKTYQNVNGLRGRKLYNFLAILFAVFLVIGTVIGYFIPETLTRNEVVTNPNDQYSNQPEIATYKGVVTYLGSNEYSNEKVEYSLNDIQGNDIVLLRSNDAKLSIAQGLFVTVTGRKMKTADGKAELLQVTEVTIKNDSD